MELLSIENMHGCTGQICTRDSQINWKIEVWMPHINRHQSLYLLNSLWYSNQSFHGNFVNASESQITHFSWGLIIGTHLEMHTYGSGSFSAIPGRSPSLFENQWDAWNPHYFRNKIQIINTKHIPTSYTIITPITHCSKRNSKLQKKKKSTQPAVTSRLLASFYQRSEAEPRSYKANNASPFKKPQTSLTRKEGRTKRAWMLISQGMLETEDG
jgi:hypothetical protein